MPTRAEQYSKSERETIYDALVEAWNNQPERHVRIRAQLEKLMEEFNPDVSSEKET
jgi:hypothetical protein